MMECEVELKKCGNSVGLIVPKEALEKESMRPRQKVRALITPIKTLRVKNVFGKQKPGMPVREIMASIDKEFETGFGK